MSLTRRTPLARRTPLKQGGPLKRGAPLQRTALKRKPASDQKEADEFRRRVMAVDYCQVGAPGCTLRSEQAHHVLPRGMGGGSAHDRALGLAVCRPCHAHLHANPEEAYERGWLIRHGTPT